jgi:hypothetical protein
MGGSERVSCARLDLAMLWLRSDFFTTLQNAKQTSAA